VKNFFDHKNYRRIKDTLKPLLLLISASLIILSFFEISRLKAEILLNEAINANLSREYYLLNASNSRMIEDFLTLSEEHDELSLSNSELNKNYELLLINYSAFDEKFSELENNYTVFENTISSQLSYFKLNSNIENASEYGEIREELKKCYYLDSINTYKINLPCINFILSHESEGNNFIYKNDTRNELLSLEEFYANKGGDCDDWARAFMASFNYIKGEIRSLNPSNEIILLTYGGSCVSQEKFFLTTKHDWYITSCPITITNHDYIQAICGAKPSDIYGHCWVAFSEEKINSTGNINEIITSSVIVEPQSGEHFSSYTQSLMQEYNHFILMTENDLIMKTDKEDDNSWKGYNDYYNEVVGKKEEINNLISNLP